MIEFFEFIIAVRHVVPMSFYVMCEKFQLVLSAWVNGSQGPCALGRAGEELVVFG